jgi:hypothetical protein
MHRTWCKCSLLSYSGYRLYDRIITFLDTAHQIVKDKAVLGQTVKVDVMELLNLTDLEVICSF